MIYGKAPENETRYSPAKILSSNTEVLIGSPNPKHIATSYVERQNLTMRMGMRRFTRLTNALQRRSPITKRPVALHFMHYNFCRIHKTLRVTPAKEAGRAQHPWTVEELVGLLNAAGKKAA